MPYALAAYLDIGQEYTFFLKYSLLLHVNRVSDMVWGMAQILFICRDNSCLSQMSAAIARSLAPQGVEIMSAGLCAGKLHGAAVQVMREAGLDMSDALVTALPELHPGNIDIVITMTGDVARDCPLLPGNPLRIDWNIEPGDDDSIDAVRRMRDELRKRVVEFFGHGYCRAMLAARACENLILSNTTDGIMAHDMQRRIFFFNKAAEEITGYGTSEVMGRDCHDVFPGYFCGAKCCCAGDDLPDEDTEREVLFTTHAGERRQLQTRVRIMREPGGGNPGILVSFRDCTRERYLERRVGETQSFSGIIGRDPAMLEVFDLIKDLADTNAPVLIQGESGTGKELVAAAIHNEGPRAGGMFVPVNCGALPESLLESELFGHVKGAFTGAIRDKKGRFELADGGTIFLDEIGDISTAMQVKLLRVLQEGRFERVGSEKTLSCDVRVVSATNKILAEEIAAGRFREDLYYRLSVVPLWLPPLRDRRSDIPLLAESILNRLAGVNKRGKLLIAQDTLDILVNYDWPDNVRELENWFQFALVKCKGDVLRPEHLPPVIPGLTRRISNPAANGGQEAHSGGGLDDASIRAALARTNGNKVKAAKVLGVSRATLYRYLARKA